ncbi:ATP-binding protein [Butyrivibrio sp. JL13D10]|uniref:ATP-binding protein n=1 Tax=Butyrivibrio sp. JL13D10 TaxID=3236815 RepID=UPI0038B4D1AD
MMKQKVIRVFKIQELNEEVRKLRKEFTPESYVDGYVDVCVGSVSEESISSILLMLESSFPKLKIIGITSGSTKLYFEVEQIITLNFVFLENTKVRLLYKKCEIPTDSYDSIVSYAEDIKSEIDSIGNVKAICLYFARTNAAAPKVIDSISQNHENIPIFGAISNANFAENMNGVVGVNTIDSLVFANTDFGGGIVAMLLYSEELYVYEDYIFGWEPIGRFLEVELSDIDSRGKIKIEKIDGEPAANIYEKYLGVKPDSQFVNNVCEFPMMVQRDGFCLGRTPSGVDEEGNITIEGDIRAGERIRFSYAEQADILRKTNEGAARIEAFGAQALTLIVCGNRINFLQNNRTVEIDRYENVMNAPAGLVFGMGEIYKYHGKGGVLNSALIAIGMREGLGSWTFSVLDQHREKHEHNGIIPLHERLAHFLSAMTGELQEIAKEAEAANEAKSSFLSNMSHEIRTPINAILGMDEMILRESSDDKVLEYAQNIKTAGNTLLGLINDILDFSKIEAGKMDVILVEYDVSSVINDLMHMIKPRINAKGLELIFDVNTNIPGILYGDEIRLKQIITNILTNAVKYTDEGSVTLSINYKEAPDGCIDLLVSVKDTGIGIKPEDLNRLYNAFQRVDEKRNRSIEGTGLGLNITQKLLKLMGSKLEVSSTYGEGSLFSFVLRQKVIKPDPIGDYMESYQRALVEREKYHERFIAPEAKVLVVDDTPMNITVFAELLKKTEVQIDTANDGYECLEKTRDNQYDIIFLDHRMPGIDGIETLKRLKSDEKNKNITTPVISLTANAISGARETYISAGFTDYLTKPIMSEKLELMMTKHLPVEKVKMVIDDSQDREDKTAIDFSAIPEWIKNAPLSAIEEGIKNCGSEEAFIAAAHSFKDNIESNFNDIKRAFENEDIENYTIKVHSLKSSARIIGALRISELARSLEEAGDNGDIEKIREDTPRLLNMYKHLWDKFFEYDNEHGQDIDKTLPVMEEDAINEAKNAIKEMAESFDYDSIGYIMETIQQYRVSQKHKAFFTKLKKAISDADWDKIKSLLKAGGNDG